MQEYIKVSNIKEVVYNGELYEVTIETDLERMIIRTYSPSDLGEYPQCEPSIRREDGDVYYTVPEDERELLYKLFHTAYSKWEESKAPFGMKVIVEQPLFTLSSSYCDFRGGRGEEINLYPRDFKEAMVGKIWTADYVGNCGRGNSCESLEVVYKNEKGVAVIYRNWGTTNSDNPEDWENEPQLIWIELGN